MIESKKNIELFKIKLEVEDKADSRVLKLSQNNSIPRSKSIGNASLPIKEKRSSLVRLPKSILH